MQTSESREGDCPPSQPSCSGQEAPGPAAGSPASGLWCRRRALGGRDWSGGGFGASVKVPLAFSSSPSTCCELAACQALCWESDTWSCRDRLRVECHAQVRRSQKLTRVINKSTWCRLHILAQGHCTESRATVRSWPACGAPGRSDQVAGGFSRTGGDKAERAHPEQHGLSCGR